MKSKFLVPLACFGLLLTALAGCGNKPSDNPSSSSKAPVTSSSSGESASPSSASSAPVVEDDKYYALPFGYDAPTKWEKGHEYKWTFDVKENHAEMEFAFGAQMSSSSHSDRSLYTNHEGASTQDPFESNEANDGTPRITLKVNGVQQTIYTTTYGDAGLTDTELNYFRVAKFAVKKGNVEVSMTTHASVGYRLMLGGEARLYYPAKEEPLELATVTFMSGTEKVFEDQYFPGEVPALPEGVMPSKAPDANGAYIFRGWDKEVVAVAATDKAVTYNAAFEAVPFVVENVKVEAKDSHLVLSADGKMKVQDTTALTAGFQTKHNDNLDHHGWDLVDHAATATFGQGTFAISANIDEEAKMIEFRDSALILSVKIGEVALELKNEWRYDAGATHDVNGVAVPGTWLSRPNVVLTGTQDVTSGKLSAHLEAGNVDTWYCIYLHIHNDDVKSLAAKSVSLKEIEGEVYYIIRGEAIGYSEADLAAARVDYQFNDNAGPGKGWGFIPALTDAEIAAAEADERKPAGLSAGDWAGQALAEGHAPDLKKIEGEAFEIGFKITDLAATARASEGAAVLTVHYSLQTPEQPKQRPSVSFPIDADYAPIAKGEYRYSIYQSLEQTWGIASIMISKPAEDFFVEGAAIEADDNGVYYVVSGLAGAHTKAEFEAGSILFQHNDNLDHAGWGIPVENLAPAKVEVANGLFKQYFKVNDVADLKPTTDGASFVFTTKLVAFEGAGQIEMKKSIVPGASVTKDGYEYSVIVSGDTWNIVDLKVTKLAA